MDNIYELAAKRKAFDVLNLEIPHVMVDHEKFSEAWHWAMANIYSPAFWRKTEEARDQMFATFCRLYVLHQASDERELRGAARMFDKVRELYTHLACKAAANEFERNIKAQGFRFIGMDKGVKQYRQGPGGPKFSVKTPKPRKVKIPRKKH